jgi:hypothetical protein
VHEIQRIDGVKVFQNIGNVFWMGGNMFYDRKNKILIKITVGLMYGIKIIAEFRGILCRFPKKGRAQLFKRDDYMMMRQTFPTRRSTMLVQEFILVDASHKEEVASHLSTKRRRSYSREKLVDLCEGAASTKWKAS